MAQLIEQNGKGFINRGNGWEELSPSDYMREQIYQNHVQGLSTGQQALTAAGKYFSDFGSGISQLLGDEENAREQQQKRADLQQRYQQFEDYGGFGESLGSFIAPAASAVIPGGLGVQAGIGGVQGAAEMPNSPVTGAGVGVAATFLGDWVGNALGRMARTLSTRRKMLSPDPYYRETIEQAQEQGFKFRPGQIADDPARVIMENQLRKNPRFAGLDMQRFLDNQARLNNLAAETLGLPGTGRVTPAMRGQAVKSVGDAFDAIANESSPIQLLGKDWIDEFGNMTDQGRAFMETVVNKFPTAFEGDAISGQQFVQMRNWMAKQARATANIQSGIADEIQPFLRIMDDSLEASNLTTNPQLVDNIRNARKQWKSLLVIENSMRGAQQAASGNISPLGGYNALKKYDKGGIFRGRRRDAFDEAINALAMTGDTAPPVMPSLDASRNPIQGIMDMLYAGPAAEQYMKGTSIGDIMMGVYAGGPPVPGAGTAGIGTARGLMAEDENIPQ